MKNHDTSKTAHEKSNDSCSKVQEDKSNVINPPEVVSSNVEPQANISSIDGLILHYLPATGSWIGIFFTLIHISCYCVLAMYVKVLYKEQPEIESNHILVVRFVNILMFIFNFVYLLYIFYISHMFIEASFR